jgi:hypothetical protein
VPTIHQEDGLVFYFYSQDIKSSEPPHVHVGKGSQGKRDAKIWIDAIGVAREGDLSERQLNNALAICARNQNYFLRRWNEHKDRG